MSIGPSAVLASDEIEALERDVIAEAQAGRKQAAWHKVQPLRNAQLRQPEAPGDEAQDRGRVVLGVIDKVASRKWRDDERRNARAR